MKCSIMSCSEFNVPTVVWEWTQNVSGSLDECIARLNLYKESARHGQKYILVDELNSTTNNINSGKLITELKVIHR